MSTEASRIRADLVDQLSSLDSRLDEQVDDVNMLSEIQDGIARLLGSDGGSEAEIRRVLQERYDNGKLRKETFQLVKSMLDRYVTEIIETSPSIEEAAAVLDGKRKVPRLRVPARKDKPIPPAKVAPKDKVIKPDAADGRVQVGLVLRDRFMLQERVDGGSMGVVYKALDRRMAEAATEEPWVAVKVLAPQLSQNGSALRALQQEAAKGRCLVHPNIVRFIDLDRDESLYFIVMEWLQGRTLGDILDSADAKIIDKARAFRIVRQIGSALDYAHKCGIVHADVKPANIMILPNGDAKLFDFGIARVRQRQTETDKDFDPAVLGLVTPAYSSMQVLTGETPVPSDDVFSLACLYYRLIAGYRVFGPRNAAEAAEEGMAPQRLEGLSDVQWRVLKKALSYARVARFGSVAEFMEALDVDEAESITVDIPVPKRIAEPKKSGSAGRLFIGLVVLAALGIVGANQMGFLDSLKQQYLVSESELTEAPAIEDAAEPTMAEPQAETGSSEVAAGQVAASGAAADDAADADNIGAEMLADQDVPGDDASADGLPDATDEAGAADTVSATEASEEVVEPLIDFSKLPPPTATLPISVLGGRAGSVTVRIREDQGNVTVDLVRKATDFPLTLRIEEIGYSGNRSPWASGQFSFSNEGLFEFPVGQERARVTLSMASDPLREADQESTLRVREADAPGSEIATINVLLEDDDQRRFESRLPANTIAFATSQVSVREQDPAVQLDIIRFNPDDSSMIIGYALRDITATLGEDYFAPGGYTIEFGPGQRSTRLLIPLVQDSVYENNEAFSVELSVSDSIADRDVYRRVAIMIRDDDQ